MHCTHRHKRSIIVLRVTGTEDPGELIEACLKHRMILSSKTGNQKQSMRDRERKLDPIGTIHIHTQKNLIFSTVSILETAGLCI